MTRCHGIFDTPQDTLGVPFGDGEMSALLPLLNVGVSFARSCAEGGFSWTMREALDQAHVRVQVDVDQMVQQQGRPIGAVVLSVCPAVQSKFDKFCSPENTLSWLNDTSGKD